MERPKILLTRRWPEAIEAKLHERYDVTLNEGDRPMSPEDIRTAMLTHDAVLPTVTDTINKDALNAPNARCKILANYGVGFSHICAESAKSLGLVVTNTPDVLSDCTADIAMTLMLMVARRAGDGEREVRKGAWSGWRPTHMIGRKVTGKTLGIIGFGRIGQEMARRAHFGFGMKVLVQSRSKVPDEVLGVTKATQVDSLEALLPQCDFVSLHCPGGAANRHMINAERLALMKPSAYLINTSRGEIINEHALIQALSFGTIGGAGLDVFDGEPRISPALMDCDNLVMLPHLGSASQETREAMGERVMANLEDFFSGNPPRDRVI
jgi:glyoxylate reductase